MSLSLLLSTLVLAPAAADVLAPGFAASEAPYPVGAAIRNLSDGSLITCDGLFVRRWLPGGGLALTLGTFSAPGETGALEVDPTETFVLAGNATTGELLRVELSGPGQTALGTLPNNRAAAFESPASAIVSAATCGTGCGNALVRLDTVTGAQVTLVAVEGHPGPVALDNAHNLFYGTVSAAQPQPAGSSALLSFPAAALASPPPASFQANAGIVVMEVESSPPHGDWTEASALAGFTGTAYYRWDGPDMFGSPGSGTLTYSFEVTEPDTYQFNYHNRHDNPASDQSNDAWVRVDGGEWLKVFSNEGAPSVGVWNWLSIAEDASGAKFPAKYVLSAGQHTLEISGRSNGFMVDRMVFFRPTVVDPFNLARPQSIFAPFNHQDGATMAAGLDGASGMVHEPEQDLFFLAENNAALGVNRILRVTQDGAVTDLVAGSPFQTLANLDYTPQPGTGVFHPFQPGGNGALGYTRAAPGVKEHRVLAPLRPELRLTGPGTATGTGWVALGLKGAAPSGFAFLVAAPAGAVSPVELPVYVGGLPLIHTGIALAAALLIPTPLPCDAAGGASLVFFSSLGAPDVVGVQAFLLNASGELAGTSTTDFL